MNIKSFFKSTKAFTLIELLLVVVILSALAVTVFVALNPAQRLKDTRDARRTSDVDTILTAIHQYIVDNKGSYMVGTSAPMSETQIGTAVSGCAIATGGCAVTQAACVNLSSPLSRYLKSVPIDPTGGTTFTAAETGYSVVIDGNGLVTVRACGTEGTTNIESSR